MITPPALSDSLLTDDFFFGESSVPSCELPCWQGLVVGESGREEIQAMYDTVFGFDGMRQFILDNPPETDTRFLPAEYYGGGYLWRFPADDPATDSSEDFGAFFVYERDSLTLAEILIRSGNPKYNASLSPQRVIRELGEPDHVFMFVRGTERGDILGLSLELIYGEGYVFQFSEAYIPTDPHGSIVRICLGHRYWQAGNYGKGSYTVRIFEPFGDDLDNLPPLVRAELRFLDSDNFVPLTDYFDVSQEEVTQLAIEDEDACLSANFSEEANVSSR